MLIGLLGTNPPIIEAVLAIAAGGSLVIGFRMAGHQSALSLRFALYASLVALFVCLGWFALGIGGTPITGFTLLTGIVLFPVAAVLAGLELRRLRRDQHCDASISAPPSKQTSRERGDFVGSLIFTRSLALVLIVQALIAAPYVLFFVTARYYMMPFGSYSYFFALRQMFVGVSFGDFGLFKIMNFVVLTQLVQLLMGAILLVRGYYSKEFRTTLFCVGVANLVSSSFLFCFPFVVHQPAMPELYLPAIAAFLVALIACIWSVWVGSLKTS